MTIDAPEMSLTIRYGHVQILPMTYHLVDHGDGTGELRGTWHSVRVDEDGTRTYCDEEAPVVLHGSNEDLIRAAGLMGISLPFKPGSLISMKPPRPDPLMQRIARYLGLAA